MNSRFIHCIKNYGILCIFLCTYMCTTEMPSPFDTVIVSQNEVEAQPMKLFVGIFCTTPEHREACSSFADSLRYCLEWSQRFVVTLDYLEKVPHKKSEVQDLFTQDYDCAVFITYDAGKKLVEWRLYDTAQGSMIEGKRTNNDVYRVAEQVLKKLTNDPQPFHSNIAYCKQDKKRKTSVLCVADFDGSHEKGIIQSRRILLNPSWPADQEGDRDERFLLYSEFTPRNVRLMMTDMSGRAVPVLDVDGTTVGVSYAPCSDDVVYCHSGDIWHYRYDEVTRKGNYIRLIHESSVCACPTLLNNGDVLYCTKGTIKRFDSKTKKSTTLIDNGYCVAPAYSSVGNKVAYAKRVKGQMQLFVYYIDSQKHEQITFANNNKKSFDFNSDKTDPSWAPDGLHLVFCWGRGSKSRIALLNTMTKKYHFITSEDDYCNYPCWSPGNNE